MNKENITINAELKTFNKKNLGKDDYLVIKFDKSELSPSAIRSFSEKLKEFFNHDKIVLMFNCDIEIRKDFEIKIEK